MRWKPEYPPDEYWQLDCPYCLVGSYYRLKDDCFIGHGWRHANPGRWPILRCRNCRKAFTFAESTRAAFLLSHRLTEPSELAERQAITVYLEPRRP